MKTIVESDVRCPTDPTGATSVTRLRFLRPSTPACHLRAHTLRFAIRRERCLRTDGSRRASRGRAEAQVAHIRREQRHRGVGNGGLGRPSAVSPAACGRSNVHPRVGRAAG